MSTQLLTLIRGSTSPVSRTLRFGSGQQGPVGGEWHGISRERRTPETQPDKCSLLGCVMHVCVVRPRVLSHLSRRLRGRSLVTRSAARSTSLRFNGPASGQRSSAAPEPMSSTWVGQSMPNSYALWSFAGWTVLPSDQIAGHHRQGATTSSGTAGQHGRSVSQR